MAKKKPKKGQNTVPKGKKTLKSKKKTRKPNKYNEIRSAAAQYCRDKYGKPCTNDELNKIYRELKKDYKDVPLKEVIRNLDLIIGVQKSKNTFPDFLDLFMWWDSKSLISDAARNYFNDEDTLVFNLQEAGLDTVKTKYKDFTSTYSSEIYPEMRRRMNFAEQDQMETIYPYLDFNKKKSKIKGKNRSFVWDLGLGAVQEIDFTDIDKKEPKRSKKAKVIPQKKAPSEEKPTKTTLADKNKAKELLLEEFKLGLIDKNEYRAKAKQIEDMYSKGGIL